LIIDTRIVCGLFFLAVFFILTEREIINCHVGYVMILKNDIDLSYIYKAQHVFEKFRKNLVSDQDKAGAIQAFDFSYELAWKLMKRVLESRGLESGSPKDTFRKAFEEGLISDPEVWFEFQKKRNLSSHTYNEENLDIIISSFDRFSAELSNLLTKIASLS
jgi:nucleotidyltransferase substrate binding protein, HI0074 family